MSSIRMIDASVSSLGRQDAATGRLSAPRIGPEQVRCTRDSVIR
jgi:hypothetical protein